MSKFISFLVFLIPAIGVISGLSGAVFISCFIGASLYSIKDKISFPLYDYKLEILLLLWLGLSCLWSVNPSGSFISYLKLLAITSLGASLLANTKYLKDMTGLEKSVIYGTFFALIFFAIEVLSNGIITRTFKSIFQINSAREFYLHSLDRGCTVIALTSWLIIGIMLKSGKYFLAVIYFFIITITLAISDSLAGFISFLISGVFFLLTRYFPFFRSPLILNIAFIIFGLSIIIFAVMINPKQLSDQAEFLPISAKHRLFIWHFATEKAIEKPVFGSGFASSKYFPLTDNDHAELSGAKLSLLPLHPHNSIIQIFLESGITGLILFLMLGCKYLQYIGRNHQSTNITTLNLISTGYSCFLTYAIISLISYSIWQTWFVCLALWTAVMFSMLSQNKGSPK